MEITDFVRGIAGIANCTQPGILSFPNWLNEPPVNFVNIAISSAIGLYLFLALAIVCDDYLVPAVEQLCFKLNMSYDVAGATFMAATTSAPELFVNIVGTFITEGDLGIGTIVGSSVFNTLGVAAFCGIFSGVRISMDWWPLTREVLWYTIAVTMLTCIVYDSVITWYEAAFLMIAYCVNTLFLIYDRTLQDVVREKDSECMPCFKSELIDKIRSFMDEAQLEYEEGDSFLLLQWPKEGCCSKIYWIIAWPAQVIYRLTIPNLKGVDRNLCICLLSLFLCVVWISIESYACAWMITVLGYNCHIPDSIMGITLLAVGTSIPEAISSIIVTRKGYGSMAISNSIGSNTFDIFVCLGVPWFCKALFRSEYNDYNVHLNSTGFGYISATLVTTSMMLYISFLLTRFTLGFKVGAISLFVYLLYLVYACIVEALSAVPTCPQYQT